MSWPEIEQLQAAHGNSLCGLYAPAQLRHWGQQPPTACATLVAATTVALALSSLPAQGQAPAATSEVVLSGTITASASHGKMVPVPGAAVIIEGTTLGVSTDEAGRYRLSIPTSFTDSTGIPFFVSCIGYSTVRLALPPKSTGVVQCDVLLAPAANEQAFYVKLTLADRIKWRFRRWFSPEE